MTLALLVLGAIGLLLPGMRPCLSLRGDPRWFVRLDALALGLGAAAMVSGLVATAVVGAAYAAFDASVPWYGTHLVPGGLAASLLSAAALGIAATRAARLLGGMRRARSAARIEGWLGRHQRCTDHDVVFVPAPAPIAYSVRGRRRQVVVSDGLASMLDPEALSLVIDHERAHLGGHHGRYLVLAALVETLGRGIAPVTRSALTLRLVMERAADEEATGRDIGRRRRLASVLAGLSVGPCSAGADGDALRYRATQLQLLARDRRRSPEVVAVAGIVVLFAMLLATLGHVGMDVPSLAAMVR